MRDRAEAGPTVTRRREVGHASARSVLMTVLGEFVLPRERAVWTSTLVDVLALFDVEEKSARQALARTAAEGWLASERVGRRVRWSLTPPGRRLLTEGAERIYGFGTARPDWDGHWLMLLVSVPETQRDLRHRMRTRLNWAGFGSPVPGVWISPDTSRQADAEQILNDLEVGSMAMSFAAAYGQIGSEEEMVAKAWDLSDLEGQYERFIAQFAGLAPAPGRDLLQAQTQLVHEWRRFPFLDPQLPGRLLPADWMGNRAAGLFHRLHSEWRDGAIGCWSAEFDREDAA